MTIEEIIKKYNIISLGTQLAMDPKIKNNMDDLTFAKEHKQDIIDFISQKSKERQAKIDAIEGLKEIEDAVSDLAKWNREFAASFNDVGGLGVRPKPDYDLEEMNRKYPRAAAYRKAEAYEYASHYYKATLGEQAKEKIINGEDYTAVIADMEQKWHDYTEAHIFD